MLTQVSRPTLVDCVSPFATWCGSVIVDDGCLPTVVNDSCDFCVGRKTILNEPGDGSATESSDVPTVDSESSSNKSVIWCDFVVSLDNDEWIDYERISLEAGTTEGSVGICEFMILVELENRKA